MTNSDFIKESQEAERRIKNALGISKSKKSLPNINSSPSFKRMQTISEQEKQQTKKRVPDTEHLSRMRALLVKAHQNEYFIK